MPNLQYRQYIPRLKVFTWQRNHLLGRHIPSEIWCIIHSTAGITCGYRPGGKTPLSFNYRPRFICDLVIQLWRNIHHTEKLPSHNLTYTVDYTFSYHSKKFTCTYSHSSAHAHGMTFRRGNCKHFF